MSNHKSVARNQGYTRAAIVFIERHNERKNENYSNMDVIIGQSHNNIHFKKCEGSYLGVFDQMIQNGEISTRGLKLNNEGTKPESNIIAEMVFDVNTEYFETQYTAHGYTSGYEFAKAFYAETYKMAVEEVGDDKYILSATMHADERNKGLSDTLGRDVYHYHLHVTYIPVVQKEIKWTKKCKNPALVGTVKEVISQVNHSKKWECEKVIGEDGKERLEYSYSKLQDRFHDHMKAAGFYGFERGKVGSTAEHLSVIEYKTKMRLEELVEKENELNKKIGALALTNIEVEDTQIEIENIRLEKSNLQADHDRIKNEVEGIKELIKLKVKTQEIIIPDKPTFGTNVKIPYDDLQKLKYMADSYMANEEEIKNIRKRRVDVSGREKNATEKEKDLKNRENKLLGKEGLLKNASQVKTERDNLQTQLSKLQNQINALTIENNSVKAKIQEAYSAIVSIIQAIGTLKHSTENYHEYTFENLTPKQSALFTALENFSVRLAEKNNLKEQADNMKKYVGIDESVKKELKFLEPKSRSSRGYDR